jgi:hypothetical protein
VLERYSQPQWIEEKYVGRVWMWRELAPVKCLNNLTLISNKILQLPEISQFR